MRALYSGVSGIRAHQTRMDVIGNNIANVNTTGFKASRVTFTDVFNQTLSSGSALTNPQQIGLGVAVGSTDLITDPGAFQMTGRAFDLAISGEGLFIVEDASGARLYTRAGGLDWNPQGVLINPALGMRVLGWMPDENGEITNTDQANLRPIQITRGMVSLPEATTYVTFKGNLDAAAQPNDTYETVITVYDSLGRPVEITIQFTKSDANTWEVDFWDPEAGDWSDLGDLEFDEYGKLVIDPTAYDPTDPTSLPPGTMKITIQDPDQRAADLEILVDFSKITQAYDASGRSTVELDTRDGRPMGSLEALYVNEFGQIIGRFSNGDSKTLAQIALAYFNNPAGLIKEGTSTYAESPASGAPQIGLPGTGGRGTLVPGNLEGSNVDLAQQFTDMILTQRGYQASARVVSVADDMLQEIVNLKR